MRDRRQPPAPRAAEGATPASSPPEPATSSPGPLARTLAQVVNGAPATAPPHPERAEVESSTGRPVDAVVHRGPAVDRALATWQAGAAALGCRVFLPPDAGAELIRHELTHVVQTGSREADLARDVVMGSPSADEESGRPLEGRADPQVLRRSPRTKVDTPSWPPLPTPPESFAPVGTRYDAEGNLVEQAVSGTWYLASPPKVDFPIAAGYRYRLLPLNPNASFAALRTRCLQVRDEQDAVATVLRGTGRYWFARVYYFVTVHELDNIDRGVYRYPHMKMQEVIQFQNTYAVNLTAWEHDRRAVEPNWQRAFAAADAASSWIGASKEIGNALLPSMEAHIRFDLPRAIAAVYDTHYAGIPGASLNDFRADFFAMSSVFDRANASLAPEIDKIGTDVNPFNWEWAGDVAFPFLFSVGAEREHAWQKAELISSSAGGRAATDRRLRSSMGTMHPNFDSFDVESADVRGYDWLSQPGIRSDSQPGPVHRPAPDPPAFPSRLYFRLGLPDGDQALPEAVRRDQDLQPLLDLAAWLRTVSGAVVELSGHASSEGTEHENANLSFARGGLVEYFLFRASADLEHNRVIQNPQGERGAAPTPPWRFVEIVIRDRGAAKETVWGAAGRLPSEVR